MAIRKKQNTPVSELLGKVVIVYWLDTGEYGAPSDENPVTRHDMAKTSSTIGVLIYQDEIKTILAHHLSPVGERGTWAVHTASIQGYTIIDKKMQFDSFIYREETANGK